MPKGIITTIDAVLLVVATGISFLPELRTVLMSVTLYVLLLASASVSLWRLYASGMLFMSPREVVRSSERADFSPLASVAPVMGCVAMVMLVID